MLDDCQPQHTRPSGTESSMATVRTGHIALVSEDAPRQVETGEQAPYYIPKHRATGLRRPCIRRHRTSGPVVVKSGEDHATAQSAASIADSHLRQANRAQTKDRTRWKRVETATRCGSERIQSPARHGANCVNDKVLPSGSGNQAMRSPPGVVHTPFASCTRPS